MKGSRTRPKNKKQTSELSRLGRGNLTDVEAEDPILELLIQRGDSLEKTLMLGKD